MGAEPLVAGIPGAIVDGGHAECKTRNKILEITTSWLSKVEATTKFLHVLRSSLSHVNLYSRIALLIYDRNQRCYVVKMSAGTQKIPECFLKLNETSALIQDLRVRLGIDEASNNAKEEMRRLGVELCFPIFSCHELTGVLLVGTKSDGGRCDPETIRFFHTLSHEICAEFEKENYYIHSITDPLTGLYNRNYLEEYLQNVFCQKKEQEQIAFAMIDIDHFKTINDRLGHQAGDEALKVVTERIKHHLRQEDLCFRYGGDELCIVFNDLRRRNCEMLDSSSEKFQDTIVHLTERLKKSTTENTMIWQRREVRVTLSIGIVFYKFRKNNCSKDALFAQADRLLYMAKQEGRDRIVVQDFPGEDTQNSEEESLDEVIL